MTKINNNFLDKLITKNDRCVVCGVYMPEGIGMVCKNCQEKQLEIKSINYKIGVKNDKIQK